MYVNGKEIPEELQKQQDAVKLIEVNEAELKKLLIQFKDYLDDRKVGIRKFSTISGIPRGRLEKIFAIQETPTTEEIVKLTNSIGVVRTKAEQDMMRQYEREFKDRANAEFKEATGRNLFSYTRKKKKPLEKNDSKNQVKT